MLSALEPGLVSLEVSIALSDFHSRPSQPQRRSTSLFSLLTHALGFCQSPGETSYVPGAALETGGNQGKGHGLCPYRAHRLIGYME